MEHPIPQNITSFQFKLVGDMTLKQFLYLASGLGLAYLLFLTLFPSLPLLAIPLIVISSLLGIAFAFVPISDRPLDHWVMAFLKAVYSPTKGFWLTGSGIKPNELFLKNRLQSYLAGLGTKPTLPLTRITPQKPVSLPSSPQLQTQPQLSSLPTPEELRKLVAKAQEAQNLQNKIIQAEREIKELQTRLISSEASAHQDTQIKERAYASLQNLVEQTQKLHQQTPQATSSQPQTKPDVVVVEPLKEPRPQLALTSLPNVINGVVADSSGNPLEGVIIITHNKDGIPVRASKTNKLGQFTGATPLPAGTYTLAPEKDNFTFDNLQITLKDTLLSPIKIQPKNI